MSEPRLRPLTKEEATGTQRLLIESAEHNGAPIRFVPRSTRAPRPAGTGCGNGTNSSMGESFQWR